MQPCAPPARLYSLEGGEKMEEHKALKIVGGVAVFALLIMLIVFLFGKKD